jgi:hypothetical protein
MSSRETAAAILVSALAICVFLGAIRLMSSDHKLQAWYPHTVMTTPADDDYDDFADYEVDEASQDNAEESESSLSD